MIIKKRCNDTLDISACSIPVIDKLKYLGILFNNNFTTGILM